MTTMAPPITVGPYTLETEIGRGAFGVVYRGHHRDRPAEAVAIKLLEAKGDAERLLLEPALLAQLDHPCIVGVEDYFVVGSQVAIALEFIDGPDLRAALERGDTFSAGEVRQLLIQVGGALAAAHARGIVHRDLKPANVMVEWRDGRPRFVLTDFGIGRRDEGIQAEKHGGGTYHFMAPEQLRGRPGPQSDLWALGVVAYRLLTGKLPFPGPGLAELQKQILYTTPTPPDSGDPTLDAAVMKLLDKSLGERFASAGHLLKHLGYDGDSRNVLKRSAVPVRRDANEHKQESLDRTLKKRMRRYKWFVGCCVAIFMFASSLASGPTRLAGMVLFIAAMTVRSRDRKKSLRYLVASFVTLAIGWVLGQLFANYFGEIMKQYADSLQTRTDPGRFLWFFSMATYGALNTAGGIIAPLLGGYFYAELRQARREHTLHTAALHAASDPERFLSTLRTELETRYEDVGFHLKYAEALFARGDQRSAAVEARLLLEQDPYHFGGNLLLAHAYAALGLDADAERVCAEYLDVAGYCFEFAELRQQCRARQGTP